MTIAFDPNAGKHVEVRSATGEVTRLHGYFVVGDARVPYAGDQAAKSATEQLARKMAKGAPADEEDGARPTKPEPSKKKRKHVTEDELEGEHDEPDEPDDDDDDDDEDEPKDLRKSLAAVAAHPRISERTKRVARASLAALGGAPKYTIQTQRAAATPMPSFSFVNGKRVAR